MVSKNKDIANNDLIKTRDDLINRIEDLEKSQIEYAEENARKHTDQKLDSNKSIKSLDDKLS